MSKQPRPLRIESGAAYVPLSNGMEAIIDLDDVPWVSKWCWTVALRKRSIYAYRLDASTHPKKIIYLHRAILSAPADRQVDHINGDGLDNRRCNLRIATVSENRRNQRLRVTSQSGLKGVSWSSERGKWRAQIGHNGKRIALGYFSAKEDAHDAYCEAASKLHGAFGRTA